VSDIATNEKSVCSPLYLLHLRASYHRARFEVLMVPELFRAVIIALQLSRHRGAQIPGAWLPWQQNSLR